MMRIEPPLRAAAAALVLLSTFLAACKSGAKASEPDGPKREGDRLTYSADAPELDSLVLAPAEPATWPVVRTTGRLAWDEDVTARVFSPVVGRVTRLIAQPGQAVERGAALALIDSSDYGQAQADATRAATDLKAAERNLDRAHQLFEHGAAARKELEAAEADRSRAAVEAERAQRRLDLLGGRTGSVDQHFDLRSPVAGTVVERAINPGQEIRNDAQAPFFVVSDPAQLWIYLDISEREIPLVRSGMKLRLRCAAYPERVFDGELTVLGDTLDAATRTVKARGAVPNPERLLKAEMYVDVEVVDPQAQPVLQVPAGAVVADGERRYVFVEEARGRFARRAVRTGAERAGFEQVLDGLRAGERVVVDGSLLLQSVFAAAA